MYFFASMMCCSMYFLFVLFYVLFCVDDVLFYVLFVCVVLCIFCVDDVLFYVFFVCVVLCIVCV